MTMPAIIALPEFICPECGLHMLRATDIELRSAVNSHAIGLYCVNDACSYSGKVFEVELPRLKVLGWTPR